MAGREHGQAVVRGRPRARLKTLEGQDQARAQLRPPRGDQKTTFSNPGERASPPRAGWGVDHGGGDPAVLRARSV